MRTAIKRALGRTLTVAALATAFGIGAVGCDSTELTAQERSQAIWRNWNVEGRQIVDDTDHLLLLRPSSQLTPWHIR